MQGADIGDDEERLYEQRNAKRYDKAAPRPSVSHGYLQRRHALSERRS
jgi:hypothetical protein